MRDDLLTEAANATERVLFRRCLEKRIDGYTLEAAAEIARAIIPIVMEDAASEASVKVLAWLGYWRDGIDPEAVRQLQEIAQSIRSRVSEMERG